MDPFHPQARDDRPERPELFISYASPDLDRAAALHTRLAAEGFRVWFDNVRLNPGCDWDAPLLRGTGSDQITDDDEAGGDADPHVQRLLCGEPADRVDDREPVGSDAAGEFVVPWLRNRWFADSSLEGTGFEPSVPLL